MNHKTKRPADAAASAGPRKTDRLGSKISSTNNANGSTSQAPCPADDAGEDDWTYFRARPGVNTRTRLPFENEYHACVLLPGRPAFVHVEIERDADRQLKRRRRLRFCEGGTA
jgi:hypothetical protein